ncbi:MAG: hypothetical protein O3C27_17225 [Actinomycetota bacterium]|nr:hypothetical protein [Actinomycetota bacterium]
MNHSLNISLISDDAIMINGYFVGDPDARTKNNPRRRLYDFKCRDRSVAPGDMGIVGFNQTHDYKPKPKPRPKPRPKPKAKRSRKVAS